MDSSTAPQIIPSSIPLTQYVDGFPLPGLLPIESYRSALSYKPRSDDIFISTYMKCGTTWAQHILLLIFKQGEPTSSMLEFMIASPYIEFGGIEAIENMPRPGAIKCHLPYHLAPKSSQAKYIYITRNPKDCCVSFFHHLRNIHIHAFNGTFDEFFELFMTGNVDYGDYFDHLLGWYAHRNDPNVLFLTYEQMKENTEEVILKIASFIDDKRFAEPLRNDPEKLQKIIQNSSFKHMKEQMSKAFSEVSQLSLDDLPQVPDAMKKVFALFPAPPTEPSADFDPGMNFIRKGIIGDWKNYFSPEQNKRMDEKFAERTKGTDIPDLWRKYM